MQNLRLPLTGLFMILVSSIYAQSKKESSPNSLNPGGDRYTPSSAIVKHTKKKKKVRFFAPRRPNVKHTARYEYYERIEKAAKEKQRMLKELSKPQYSDFRYFGHKKIPKRRSPNKMRYCEECGIRH